MKRITDAEYDEHMRLKAAVQDDQVLTPDGLRFICEAYEFDAEKIGQHFLDLLPGLIARMNQTLPPWLQRNIGYRHGSENQDGTASE